MDDFARHRMDIEVRCRCGHYAVLPRGPVLARFDRMGWSTSLEGACWLPSAHARFFCTVCRAKGRGKVRPVRIGPGQR